MGFYKFLFTSGVLASLVLLGSKKTFHIPRSPKVILQTIQLQYLALKQSTQMALERSHSLALHEAVQSFHEQMAVLEQKSVDEQTNDNHFEHISPDFYPSSDIQRMTFNDDSQSHMAFDEAYIIHQLKACREIIVVLEEAINSQSNNLKEYALKLLTMVSNYQSTLKTIQTNQFPANELEIREVAHEIWEAEGKPEGKAEHHWSLAVELLKKIPPDQKMVF
jgi:predicted outer membrane protein